MASILDMEKSQELKFSSNRQKITQFIQTGMLGEASLIEEILIMSNNFITGKKQIQ